MQQPICPECKTQFQVVNSIPSFLVTSVHEPTQTRYEREARERNEADYSRMVGMRFKRQHDQMRQAFESCLKTLPRDALLLDVGCGNGALTQNLSATANVVGVDFSLAMLEVARRSGLDVYHADAARLPFASNQFSAVICAEVIQHVPELSPLFGEISRVCAKGGEVIVSTLNARSVARRVNRRVSKWLDPNNLRVSPKLWSAAQINAVAKACGLNFESFVWLHYPLPWNQASTSPTYPLAVAATNVLLRYRKN